MDDPDVWLTAVVGLGYLKSEVMASPRKKGLEAVMKVL